jgi:hypothetical protein
MKFPYSPPWSPNLSPENRMAPVFPQAKTLRCLSGEAAVGLGLALRDQPGEEGPELISRANQSLQK